VPILEGHGSGASVPRFTSRSQGVEPFRSHVAAICYRVEGDSIQFLLVRTRAGRWTFPKGKVEGDPSRAAAAAREAFEEAGVFGRVELRPMCRYVHSKECAHEHLVDAHLCEVVSVVKPQETHRDPTWFDADKAKRRLGENRKTRYASELSQVVDRAIQHIERRRRA
jgi:8-oxo-dGTP pyrophosphatase MutT (NUDIX family)